MSKKAVIIGAGPAGLTAAYELLVKSNVQPIVIECDREVGGISKTIDYKGNKIDLGGHRFFSKSELILNWWQQFLPIYSPENLDINITYHQQNMQVTPNQMPTKPDESFLVVPRKSHIYYKKKLFSYPLQLTFQMLQKLGFWQSIKIATSILYSRVAHTSEPETLEEFYIQRFGNVLYNMFFKEYTEKVWGTKCTELSAEWGRQRVKDLSLRTIILHYFQNHLVKKS